ncbi:MAG: FAD-binding oxidoreductase [Pseudomonadales bacterium]
MVDVTSERPAPGADFGPSLWAEALSHHREKTQPTADLPTQADVVIVGGGFSGLWTAYYLSLADPHRSITLLEAEHVGFGASGRNGGWCMGWAEGIDALLERPKTRTEGLRWARAMQSTLGEIKSVLDHESIDCDFHQGGTLTTATNRAQLARLQRHHDQLLTWGFDESDFQWLAQKEALDRARVEGALGAQLTPHCAVIHPAKLVAGLARVLRARGVRIYERVRVTSIRGLMLSTNRGNVACETLIRATEAYTRELPGYARLVVPVVSAMVATAPLRDALWASIGLADRPTFCDARRVTVYGQRTQDGRIAFGARARHVRGTSLPAQYASTNPIFEEVERALYSLFPQLSNHAITHRWAGVLAISPRRHLEVAFDRDTQQGHLGGYMGEGVAASNFAARRLVERMMNLPSDWVDAPFYVSRPKKWIPDPMRSAGIAIARHAAERADAAEQKGATSPFWGRVFNALV